jgi:hypothetical protein
MFFICIIIENFSYVSIVTDSINLSMGYMYVILIFKYWSNFIRSMLSIPKASSKVYKCNNTTAVIPLSRGDTLGLTLPGKRDESTDPRPFSTKVNLPDPPNANAKMVMARTFTYILVIRLTPKLIVIVKEGVKRGSALNV